MIKKDKEKLKYEHILDLTDIFTECSKKSLVKIKPLKNKKPKKK